MPPSDPEQGNAAVSRYFKYKSSQSLRDDARRIGLNVELEDDLAPLRTATRVGGRTVGNRLAIQPMEGCDGNLDGTPGELTLRRYRRFGAGGAKLIWGEACAVVPEGRANPRQLLIDETTTPALEQLVPTCRGALAQPDFGRRVMRGEALDPKRLCRTFRYCTALMRSKHNDLGQFATGCPPFDKEVYGPIWDATRR